MQFWEANLQSLIQYLASVTGVLSVLALIGMAIAAMVNDRMRQVALAVYFLILFVGPVPEIVENTNSTINVRSLIEPFSTFRQNSRAMMSLSFLVVVPIVFLWARPLLQRSLASMLYLGLQVGWSFFQFIFGGSPAKIALGMICFTLCWYIVTGRPIRTAQEWYENWKPVVWALIVFTACHVFLFAVGSPGMMAGNRLQGMTSNPQFAAQDLAVGCIILAALAVDTDFRRAIRMPLWLVWLTIGVVASMLGMTGSRGGAIFAISGLLVLFGTNVGRGTLFALPSAIFVYFIGTTFFFVDATASNPLQRIFNGDDTRSQLLVHLFYRWMQNPLLGDGGDMSSGYNECMYLYVAMRLGVFALLYVLWMVGQAVWSTFRGAQSVRHRRGVAHRLPMAMVVAIAVQNITEAALLSQFTISTSVFLLCCELGVTASLLQEGPAEEYEYAYADGRLPSPAF